jgi:hypothetical protein
MQSRKVNWPLIAVSTTVLVSAALMYKRNGGKLAMLDQNTNSAEKTLQRQRNDEEYSDMRETILDFLSIN